MWFFCYYFILNLYIPDAETNTLTIGYKRYQHHYFQTTHSEISHIYI